MRVAILGREFPPTIGGIADYTDLVAAELSRRGMTVTVVCAPPAEQRASFVVSPNAERWDAAGIPGTIRAIEQAAPDAILWQYNPFNLGRHGIALRAAPKLARELSKRARLIVIAHELWFPWGRGGLKGLAWALAQRYETKRVLRRAHAIVVTTASREAALKQRYGERVARIPVGTNIEPREATIDARARFEIPHDAFVIAHFGTAGPGKHLGPAFDALSELRARGIDARLVLAGKTGMPPVPEALTEVVHFTGVLARTDLSALLQTADCYLHPDPSGPSAGRRGSLVAALAHALPIVAYRGPDHEPELVDGENVVLCAPDGGELAATLEKIRRDPDFARRIGRSGRRTFDRTFSWTRIGEHLQGVLQDRH